MRFYRNAFISGIIAIIILKAITKTVDGDTITLDFDSYSETFCGGGQ